jgi:hypothetical protein
MFEEGPSIKENGGTFKRVGIKDVIALLKAGPGTLGRSGIGFKMWAIFDESSKYRGITIETPGLRMQLRPHSFDTDVRTVEIAQSRLLLSDPEKWFLEEIKRAYRPGFLGRLVNSYSDIRAENNPGRYTGWSESAFRKAGVINSERYAESFQLDML